MNARKSDEVLYYGSFLIARKALSVEEDDCLLRIWEMSSTSMIVGGVRGLTSPSLYDKDISPHESYRRAMGTRVGLWLSLFRGKQTGAGILVIRHN